MGAEGRDEFLEELFNIMPLPLSEDERKRFHGFYICSKKPVKCRDCKFLGMEVSGVYWCSRGKIQGKLNLNDSCKDGTYKNDFYDSF